MAASHPSRLSRRRWRLLVAVAATILLLPLVALAGGRWLARGPPGRLLGERSWQAALGDEVRKGGGHRRLRGALAARAGAAPSPNSCSAAQLTTKVQLRGKEQQTNSEGE